ncbi:hypothetical protein [Jeotgalibacillus salarius]|uniref:Uncharacterized protein n=1 Tax=Jeotgalibacillus salarius TaxID=546023 RepID=A0A4Y8LEK9_9BACL|nr:hypothetical protein [Jeotgalibacillus salarius]TFE00493.1 hypothetical protein E2626_10970 [Jeotgalibacillus salarius]
MLEIILCLMLLAVLYAVLRKGSRKLMFTVLGYYIILSVVFIIGLNQIDSNYQLYTDPVDGGFAAKFNWVATFAYLYIIPFIILLSYKLFKWVNKAFHTALSRIAMKFVLIASLIFGGYIAMFAFVLTFYGFAP